MQRNEGIEGLFIESEDFFKPDWEFSHSMIEEEEGDTSLHHLLHQCTDPNELIEFIDRIGEESAAIMAKTMNDCEELLLDLIDEDNLTQEVRDKFYDILLPLTLPKDMKPLSEFLDFETIQKAYQPARNSELELNLALGVQAANYARGTVDVSYTHPQLNGSSFETWAVAHFSVEGMRARINTEVMSIVRNSSYDIYRFKTKNPLGSQYTKVKLILSSETINQISANNIAQIKRERRGNCDELSSLAKRYLSTEHHKNISAERFWLQGGDHAYLVINRGSSSNQFKDWHESAVVCDPWAGKVYPASLIASKLGNYVSRKIQYGEDNQLRHINIITALNFNICSLVPDSGPLPTKYIITHEGQGFANSFVERFREYFSAHDMVNFYLIIAPSLQRALEERLVTVDEIESLHNPLSTLYAMFLNEYGMQGLREGLFTLKEVDALPVGLLVQLMDPESIKCLSEAKESMQAASEISAQKTSTKRKRPIDTTSSLCQSAPASLTSSKQDLAVSQASDYSGRLFKKCKTQANEESVLNSLKHAP